MSSDNSQILVRMAIMAARRQGLTLADIQAEFGKSYRTAQRMAALLQDTFPAIDRDLDDDGRTMRLKLPHVAVQALLFPTADELVAVTAAFELVPGTLESNLTGSLSSQASWYRRPIRTDACRAGLTT